MLRFIKGFVIGAIFAFPLGINFGKDAPLFSNPFAVKPDISERLVEKSGRLLNTTRQAIHEATRPVKE